MNLSLLEENLSIVQSVIYQSQDFFSPVPVRKAEIIVISLLARKSYPYCTKLFSFAESETDSQRICFYFTGVCTKDCMDFFIIFKRNFM